MPKILLSSVFKKMTKNDQKIIKKTDKNGRFLLTY